MASSALIPLVTPVDTNRSPAIDALVDCFRVVDLDEYRPGNRSYKTDTWRSHGSKLITMTAKGAGGTGKTTAAWNAAAGLVMNGEKNAAVLVANLDSQPSLEERLLGKLVHTIYHDDFNLFYEMNNLAGSTILKGLNSCLDGMTNNTLVPPKLVFVDPVRLAGLHTYPRKGKTFVDPGDSGKRIYIMLSDENISEWDHQLSTTAVWRGQPGGSVFKRVPGALPCLLQMTAYVLGVTNIIMDLGPGNGKLNQIAIMCSSGWFMPLCIDNKCQSTIFSFANRLPLWAVDYVALVTQTVGADNPYPLPHQLVNVQVPLAIQQLPALLKPQQPHVIPCFPKFLGVIFSRIGARGSIRPYNQYSALLRAQELITNALIPSAVGCNMALPLEAYNQCLAPIAQVMAQWSHGALSAPPPVAGVCALMREFDSLQYMSERESVPVPFLEPHHFLSMGGPAYDQFLIDLAHNPNTSYPADHEILSPSGNQDALNGKVANVRSMTGIFLSVINNNLI